MSHCKSSKLKPLKVDFHIHTAEDPLDRVPYTAQELILKAADEGFEVIAITNHHARTFNKKLFSFARDLGILLIPGMETTIQDRHVLILNPSANMNFSDFSSLTTMNRPDRLVVAPHPYFPGLHSLNGYLKPNLKFFHALEYCHFYSSHINFNHRAMELSQSSGLPLLGNSDSHFLEQLGTTYSLIYAQKDVESVFSAIRQGQVEVVSRPLSSFRMGSIMGRFLGRKMLGRKSVPSDGRDICPSDN